MTTALCQLCGRDLPPDQAQAVFTVNADAARRWFVAICDDCAEPPTEEPPMGKSIDQMRKEMFQLRRTQAEDHLAIVKIEAALKGMAADVPAPAAASHATTTKRRTPRPARKATADK